MQNGFQTTHIDLLVVGRTKQNKESQSENDAMSAIGRATEDISSNHGHVNIQVMHTLSVEY